MGKEMIETESYRLLLHAFRFSVISDITEFQIIEA